MPYLGEVGALRPPHAAVDDDAVVAAENAGSVEEAAFEEALHERELDVLQASDRERLEEHHDVVAAGDAPPAVGGDVPLP